MSWKNRLGSTLLILGLFTMSNVWAAVEQTAASSNCAPLLQSSQDFVWEYITRRNFDNFHYPLLNAILEKTHRLGLTDGPLDFRQFILRRKILSLGEGSSDFVETLLQSTVDAFAVDAQAEDGFKRNLRKYPGRFRVQKIQSLKMKERFDLIYSSYSLNFLTFHIGKLPTQTAEQELEATLTRILSHLTEGGLLISVPDLLLSGSKPLWNKVMDTMRAKGWELEFYSNIPVRADPRLYNPVYGSNQETFTVIKMIAKPQTP